MSLDINNSKSPNSAPASVNTSATTTTYTNVSEYDQTLSASTINFIFFHQITSLQLLDLDTKSLILPCCKSLFLPQVAHFVKMEYCK